MVSRAPAAASGRSPTITEAPSRARRIAHARPIPLAAPVTRPDLPSIRRPIASTLSATMAIIDLPTQALERAGLSPVEIGEWALSVPTESVSFEVAANAASAFLTRGAALEAQLPVASKRSEGEREAPREPASALTDARSTFLTAHAGELYDELTDHRSKPIRLEWLVNDAAGRAPGLVPTHAEMEIERPLPLADKRGLELAQGLL